MVILFEKGVRVRGEGQRKIGRSKRTWKQQVEEERVKVEA